jgi:outer membrane protein TolC
LEGSYRHINVIVAQTTVLGNRITALNIANRRITAAVLLIKALREGWNASQLPVA